MSFDQASYLKGRAEAFRNVLQFIAEQEFAHNQAGTPKLTLATLRETVKRSEEIDHNLYKRICDEEWHKEASEANDGWPGHYRSCRIVEHAYMHPKPGDCTCGESVPGDPDFVAKERILEGGRWFDLDPVQAQRHRPLR